MKKVICFLAVVVCSCAGVFAQTLSLEQVRSLALANSRSLAKYNLSIKSGILDEKAQTYTNLPSLSLGGSASTSLWNAGGTTQDNPLDTFRAGANISVSQKIFEGGKSVVQKAIKALATETTRREAMAEYFNVLEAADSAYYAVLEAEADFEAAEDALQTAAISLAIAEVRHETGMLGRGDYLKTLAEKESKEAARNLAGRNVRANTAKLSALIGPGDTPIPEQVDFSGYEELILRLGSIPDTEADSLYGELWKIAAAGNPSLAKAELSNQRAEKNLSLAKRDYSPSVSMSFSTGINYTPNTGTQTSAGTISINANIPLDFWVLANNVEKNKIARDSAILDYLNTESSLETELQSALFNTIAQAGTVISSRRASEYAEQHFEYSMERYRLSLSSVSELSDASALVSSNRSQLIKARYGFLQSLSRLRTLGAFEDEEKLIRLLLGTR